MVPLTGAYNVCVGGGKHQRNEAKYRKLKFSAFLQKKTRSFELQSAVAYSKTLQNNVFSPEIDIDTGLSARPGVPILHESTTLSLYIPPQTAYL